jgi:hypothetical protein
MAEIMEECMCTKFYVELGMMYLNLEMEKKSSAILEHLNSPLN